MGIRKGTAQDLIVIMDMVKETVNIMKEEGVDQWDETYPVRSIFERDVQNSTLYVIEENGEVVGSITVDQHEPEEYKSIDWRKWGEAYTFHRLVVNPTVRKGGVATKLIQHAEQVAKEHHVPYMKIDTYSLNEKAQKTFEKNGYTKVGTMSFHGKSNLFYCYDKFL
ncbi:GNAT family N-acetyltransferase [Metabacillus iocasae]|uniref:GNAT superfamily N-acetyltransferase n=1 Tax=Priestia iocasae TaxID=2291674 RepID=A0ABS2QVB2_9BACI|nr:GNAT family N-acetyltransferase [Metabacillus iocasae]MBM7703143.1 GNAT superfamily N-acetyltransferase [Metabacillus iocasae]